MNRPVKRSYGPPLNASLSYFPSLRRFADHMLRHVFLPAEKARWERVLKLGAQPWRSLEDRRLARWLESEGGPDPADTALVESAYDDFAAILDAGLHYAVSTPIYLVLREEAECLVTQRRFAHTHFHFLSQYGFIIVARNGVVRTAFFRGSCPRTLSFYDLYWMGMHELLRLAQRAESGGNWYNADKHRRVTPAPPQRVDPANFTNRSNPWPKPSVPKGKPAIDSLDPDEALILQKYGLNSLSD